MEKMIATSSMTKPPEELRITQEWFASVITQKLNDKDKINSLSPRGGLIAEEACQYIAPSAKMRPHQRIQIYNQQYWWRLLNTMQTNFPFLTRLFGYQAFNKEIAIPYLLHYPPSSWMLSFIGQKLPLWLKNNYKKSDLPLIQNAARLDCAFTASFIAPQHPLLDLSSLSQGEGPEAFLTCHFYLQPHVQLFKFDSNLFAFREEFLAKDVDYWMKHRFPKLPKVKGVTCHYALYRTLNHKIAYREISQGEYFLLDLFKGGITIEKACEVVEEQETSLYEYVATHLQQWLIDWTRIGLLTTKRAHDEN
jgi:hypothetical protein